MNLKQMSDISSGYSSSESDWLAFLRCWKEQVGRRASLSPGAMQLLEASTPSFVDRERRDNRVLELQQVERNVAGKLPASYRDYVMITGGAWFIESAGAFEDESGAARMTVIAKVGRFKDADQVNWGAWDKARKGMRLTEVSAEEYYRYGYRVPPLEPQFRFRIEHVDKLIKVGELEQGTVLLLNPVEITSDGEWEAWLLSPQVGAKRYRSFAELMQHIAYQDILDVGGSFLPPEKLRATCAGLLRTAATTTSRTGLAN